MSELPLEPTPIAAHTRTGDDALAALGSRPSGLSAAEAAACLAGEGPNELQAAARTSAWKMLLGQLKNALIIVLLVATALSAALGHRLEAIVITIIVFFAVMLGFVQEYRAGRAIDALRKMAAPGATVLRDGDTVRVPAREVVRGDILLLKAGDRVPADARLLEAVNLGLEEAPLTGESVSVEKNTLALADPELAVGDRLNMVHSGTTVTAGRGRAVVSATGMATEFGRIATLLDTVEVTSTPLQKNLDQVGKILARAALVIVAAVVVVGLVRGQPVIDMLVFGVALAVAVVPEALPAVVTISLALGVQRMVKRNALMRRLPAVETLGGTTVICSDKTGTLTADEMTVRQVRQDGVIWTVAGAGYVPEGGFSRDGVEAAPDEALLRLMRAGALVNDAELDHETEPDRWEITGDPTEGALVVLARKANIKKSELEELSPRVDEIPFTSEARRMITFHRAASPEDAKGGLAYCKGAPEALITLCDTILSASGERPLTEADRVALAAAAEEMAAGALRVLAVAEKHGADRATADGGFTLLGLVGLIDPPRPEAAAAIQTCRDAGIRAVMITGDHPVTAGAVAAELGLMHGGRVITGAELDQLDDAALAAQIEGIDVFARVSPAHKLRVVEAFQARGNVVAMTGDGVNDAPALKRADIGIAMGISGTDVSREAAAMTLTDDNFASIVAAVEEGRGIFANIRKFLMYLLSSNIGEIGLIAGTAFMGLPLPLTAVQILYVNLATDGLPALALALDPHESDLMSRPPRKSEQGIFTRPVLVLMAVGGGWSTLATVGLFVMMLRSGRPAAEATSMVFVLLVLIELLKAYSFRSDRQSFFHRPFANRWLNRAVLWELAMLIAVVYVPFLHEAFGTYALTAVDWAIVLGVAVTVVPVIDLTKVAARRGWLGALD